ncbi:DNA ligase-1 [Paenibacillus sp. 1182]|uniref:ATP-dependent DNA ligase n=1 Tax=Paenibacillus sp. 1182 TaxID=2806565 RepID=UPI001AE7E06F|nr:DNA polymerase LigD [Paenibacillus sp. 1182]MBP1309218.1 DNA ligase-1 [Paenibacillus sp. 1182]
MLNKPFQPMVLQKSEKVPSDRRFLHQYKWDGHRLLFHYDRGKVRLFTRELNECTHQYPELQSIQLPVESCILDGECIVLDPLLSPPMPCFESVMTRFHASKESSIKKYMNSFPAHFVVWDMVFLNGKPLHQLALTERIELLEDVVAPDSRISITPSYDDGEMLFENITKIGGEGVVSKPKESKYKFGSCSDHNAWYKTKNYQYEIVEIGGIRKAKFGWSLLHKGKYVGELEFPPSKEISKAFFKIAKQLAVRETEDWIILEPILKCKVKFQCYSKSGKMRSPSFIEFI